jgi:hypothetical protein
VFRQLISLIGIVAVSGLAAWPFVQSVPYPTIKRNEPTPLTTGDELKPCTVGEPGRLLASLYGSVKQELELRGNELLCAGKLNRLSGDSRLAFSTEPAGVTANLVIVIGLESVVENTNQEGLPTNLTILDQDNGLFFGTQGNGRCWTDLNQTSAGEASQSGQISANGEVYCAGAIPQIQGPGSVTVSNLKFAGHLVVITPELIPEANQQ